VPPKHREQEAGGGFRRSNENSVRVTNIADNVDESDLRVRMYLEINESEHF